MEKRTKSFMVRLTPKEHEALLQASKTHCSISTFVRNAIKNHKQDYPNLKQWDDNFEVLKNYNRQLALAGSNLNQVVKRMHELYIAGTLPPDYYKNNIESKIGEVQHEISIVRTEIECIFTTLKKHTIKSFRP